MIQEASIQGVSIRRVDELVKALGLTGIDPSTVSRLRKPRKKLIFLALLRSLVGHGLQRVQLV